MKLNYDEMVRDDSRSEKDGTYLGIRDRRKSGEERIRGSRKERGTDSIANSSIHGCPTDLRLSTFLAYETWSI
jgi:hypothetical protein